MNYSFTQPNLNQQAVAITSKLPAFNSRAGIGFLTLLLLFAFSFATKAQIVNTTHAGNSPYATIQDAINDAATVDGDEITVGAGTYEENVTINKRIKLLGAQNEFFAPATFINTGNIGGNAITISADGIAGVGNAVEVQNIHCQGKTTDILTNNDYGINVTIPAYYLNLYNVYSDNYRFAGLIFNGTYSAASPSHINIWDCQFQACDLGINLNLGMNGVYIKGGLIKNNRYSGLITAGNDAGILDNITVEGTQFVDNGTGGLALSTFASDIFMQRFNGNGIFKDLSFTTYAATALDLRGKGPLNSPSGAAGTVQIQNCTFTGQALDANAFNKDLIKIRNYTDISNISFSGVTVNTRDNASATGLRLESITATPAYTLTGISFPNAASGNGHGFDIFNTTATNINATSGVNFGAATNFQIEDRILHKTDYAPLGLVTWVANNDYITTNSYFPPSTTTASIQRGVDAASSGFTVNVDAGTYDIASAITIDKELTIKGAFAGTKATAASRGAESILSDTRSAATNPGAFTISTSAAVEIDGFTLSGSKIITGQPANAIFRLKNNRMILAAMPNSGQTNMIWSTGCLLTLTKNYFETTGSNPSNSAVMQVAGGYNGSGTTDAMSVTGNTFKGIPDGLSQSTLQLNFSDCQGTISGNTFDGVDLGMIIAGNSGNMSVTANTFKNQTRGATEIANASYAAGILIFSPTYTGPINITGNTFQNSDCGIRSSNAGGTETGSNIHISANAFTGNLFDIVHKYPTATLTLNGDNTLAGTTISTATLSDLYNIEDKIAHKPDVAGFGLVIVKANNLYVTPNSFLAGAGTTSADIQRAVDPSSNGFTVNVKAGTYDGQVVIDNKNITLLGAGATTILRPSSPSVITSLYTYPSGVFPGWVGVVMASTVLVKNTTSVTLKDFKVDGVNVTSLPSGSGRLAGVLLGESGGVLDNVTVNTIKTTGYTSRSYGIDISATNGSRTVEVKNSSISDWARNGIQAMGGNLTANIHNNTLVGPGLIGPDNVPNGILYIHGVGGNAKANTIHELHYSTPDSRSAGVLLFDPVTAGIVVEENEIYNTDDGIILAANANDAIVRKNYIHNNEVGIHLENGTLNNAIINNTITNNSITAIRIDGTLNPNGASTPPGTGNYANNNDLSGGPKTVISYDDTKTFNATCNWHGVTGAGVAALITGDVNYIPFLSNGTDVGGNPNDGFQPSAPCSGCVSGNVVQNTTTLKYFCSIQAAIDDPTTLAGHTITASAGTYAENITVNKKITLDGADIANTLINGSITIAASGTSAADRLVVKNLAVTNSSGNGITVNGGVSFITIESVSSSNNSTNGLELIGGTGANDVKLKNMLINDNTLNGIRMGGIANLTGLTIENGEIKRNNVIGFAFNPSGNAGSFLTNLSITGTVFENNGDASFSGQTLPAGLGFGDISLFSFNGNASLQNVTITGLPSNGAHIGLQFRGSNTPAAAGTITLNNVTITGSYRRPGNHASDPGGPGYGILIQNYSDVSNISFNNVSSTITDGHALFVAGLTNTLNIGNTSLNAMNANAGHIVTGTSSQNPVLSNVNATGATFNGVVASSATLPQLFAIEDKIVHAIDAGGLGFVTVKASNTYVTPNSFVAPAITVPSIQRAVDAASASWTVNVNSGTYNESDNSIRISKALTVLGPNSGISPNGGLRVAEAILTSKGLDVGVHTIVSIEGAPVTFKGFKFDGVSGNSTSAILSYNTGTSVDIEKNIFANISFDPMYFEAPPSFVFDDNHLTNIGDVAECLQVGGNWNGVSGTTVTITNNVWDNSLSDGMNLSSVSGTISGNQFNNIQYYGVLVASLCNLNITQNVFNGITSPGGSPTYGAGVRFYTPASGLVANVTNNYFTNNVIGVAVRNVSNDGSLAGTTVHVNNNSFTGNTDKSIKNEAAETLDATCNWFNSTDLSTVAATISGPVNYTPYLTSGVDAAPGTIGFQPSVACSAPCNLSTPTATPTQPTCSTPSGTITVNTPAPAAGLTYTVTGPSPSTTAVSNATGVFPGLSAGVYAVTTSTASGCTSTAASITINAVPPSPDPPTATPTQPTCATPTGKITVNTPLPGAGISYTVTGTSPIVAPVSNSTGVFEGLAPGDYNVTTTNAAGCTSTALSVTINPAPGAPAAPHIEAIIQTTCESATGSVVLDGLPATGDWIINPGAHTGAGTSATISDLAPGTYNFTVTNEAGCTSTSSNDVVINPQPLITPTFAQVGPICQQTTFPRIFARVYDQFPGDGGVAMGAPWNNMTGVFTSNLVDELGSVTAVSLSFNTEFWAPYTGGPTTGNNSGVYPDNVLHEFYYFGYSGAFPAPETVDVDITGLDPLKKYKLTFFGASDFVNGDITVENTGSTTYTVGANTVSLATFDNRYNTVSLSNLTPSGAGTITFTMAKGPGSAIGYLNALVVTPDVASLPTHSNNATPISGSWSPELDVSTPGTTHHVFTPFPGQCATSASMDVTVYAIPAMPTATPTQPTCGTPTGTITVNAPAPGEGITYTVTGTNPVVAPVTNSNGVFSGLNPGTYDVTTSNGGICNSTALSVTINSVPGAPAQPAATPTQPTCAAPTGTITVNTPIPGANVSYTVTGPSPSTATITNTTGSFPGLAPGSYELTTTNTATGCTSLSLSVTINAVPTPPAQPTATPTQPTCAVPTGTITVNTPVPGANVSYTVTGPSPSTATVTNTTGVFAGLAPGTYSVTTTNTATQCTSTSLSVTINAVPTPPAQPSATPTQPTCSVTTGTITVNTPAPDANVTFTVTGPSPSTAAVTNTSGIFPGLAPGNYGVTTTNTATQCTSTSASVTINPIPSGPAQPTATPTQPTCGAPTGTITVNTPAPGANVSYTLTGPSPSTATVTNTSGIFGGLAPGNYGVTTTNTSTGCSSSSLPVTINTVPGAPDQPTATPTQPTCLTSTGTITVNTPVPAANVSYTITGPSPSATTVTNTTGVFPGLATGTYGVTTTNTTTGCTSPSLSVTINAVPTPPAQPAATPTQPTCASPTGTITVNTPVPGANITYTVTGPSPSSATVTNSTGVFAGLAPGTYAVSTSNTATQCTSTSASVIINAVPVPPDQPTATPTQPSCAAPTGTITVNTPVPGANVSYTVTGPSPSTATVTNTTGVFAGLAPGTYSVTTTNTATQCTSTSLSVTINPVPAPSISTVTTTQPNCATPTGTIVVNASGSGTLEYSKDNGANWQLGASFSSLAPGSYNIKVRLQSSPACVTSYSGNPVVLNVAACDGKTIPGKIEAEAFDTKNGPQYAVGTSDAGGGQHIIGITNGSWMDYNVTVLYTGVYTVNFRVATTQNNAQFQIKQGATVLGTLNVPNTGGWDTWVTVPVNNVSLTAGTQTIRIQSNSNETCNFNWTDWILPAPPTAPTANAGPNQAITLPTNQVTLAGSGTANNGGSITSHVWSKFSGGAAAITDVNDYGTTVTGLAAGTYVFRLTVNQNDGQTATSDVTITVNSVPPPTANAGPNQVITLPTNQVTLAGSGSANNPGGTVTSHVWSKLSGGAAAITDVNDYGTTVTGLAAGTYVFRLTVTQSDLQSSFSDVTITVNPNGVAGKFIPGKVEAESFDAKNGPFYAVATSDAGGGQQVVGITNGSWMDYNVTVTQTGVYTVNFRVATTQNNAQFQIKQGATVLGTLNVPNTGGWDTWMTIPLNNVSLTAGVQTIRIQSSNNESCNFNWTDWVSATPPTAPTANAGPNQTITLPTNQVTLAGSGTANNGGSITSHVWSKLTGGAAAITDVNDYGTTVTGLAAGTYVFRLTVNQNDGQTTTSDVMITVNSVPPPTVNAGPNQVITLPTNQVTMAGSGTANNPGGTVTSHVWSKLSGGAAAITDVNDYGTTVTGLAAGTYVFRLTVTQSDLQSSFSDVTITVNPAGGSGKLIPGKIEAEAFDTQSGGMYGVPTSDAGGGQQVVGITNGSTMDYNVTVTQSGTYTVSFRVATTRNNVQFQIKLGASVLGTVNIPNTGDWNTWTTATVGNIALTAGAKTIRIQSNELCNFNWMDWAITPPLVATVKIGEKAADIISPAQQVIVQKEMPDKMVVSVFPNPATSYFNLKLQSKKSEMATIIVTDIAGRQVQEFRLMPGQVLRFGDQLTNGAYFLEVRQGSERVVTKVVKQ